VTEIPRPESLIQAARETAADIKYGWKQEEARGNAEVLAHVHALAKEAGASQEQLTQITDGFTAIAEKLFAERGESRRRRPFRWPRRPSKGSPSELMAAPRRRELPPGR
jgi:hypothetical protein